MAIIFCLKMLLGEGSGYLAFNSSTGMCGSPPSIRFKLSEGADTTQTFYKLLVDTFQGEVGLSRVLNGQFMVLNGFNEVPITRKAWRAGIQPKSRVAMAIMVESSAFKKGKCVTPSCFGEVVFKSEEVARLWYAALSSFFLTPFYARFLTQLSSPNCGKHLHILKDSLGDGEDYDSDTTFHFDFGSNVSIPTWTEVPTLPPSSHSVRRRVLRSPLNVNVTDKDITAFKRVIWQDSYQYVACTI